MPGGTERLHHPVLAAQGEGMPAADLTHTNDIESRMNRVFLDMIYVVAGIQQSLESELTLMPRINRHILNSLGLLAFDFGKIVFFFKNLRSILIPFQNRPQKIPSLAELGD